MCLLGVGDGQIDECREQVTGELHCVPGEEAKLCEVFILAVYHVDSRAHTSEVSERPTSAATY